MSQYLDPAELLRELEASFGALARREVQCPARPEITVPGKGFSLAMSAWQPGMQICVKVVDVFDRNLERGLPNHLAIVNLFDPETGAVTCVMDATYHHRDPYRRRGRAVAQIALAAREPDRDDRRCWRSSAGASAPFASRAGFQRDSDLLARVRACRAPGSSASEGARPSGCEVRDQTLGRCVSGHALRGSRYQSDWVQPGTHVSSIGYHPPDGELPRALACDSVSSSRRRMPLRHHRSDVQN